jgi:hypothetical protein
MVFKAAVPGFGGITLRRSEHINTAQSNNWTSDSCRGDTNKA